jgi:hypothetical protein
VSVITFDHGAPPQRAVARPSRRMSLPMRVLRHVRRVQRLRAQRTIDRYTWLIRDLKATPR